MKYTREIKELNLMFEVDEESLISRCRLLKTQKQIWGFKFRTIENLNKKIQDQIDLVISKKAEVKNRREDRKLSTKETKANIKTGDIYLYTFSYENTYRTFYQVTKVEGAKVFVKQINYSHTSGDGYYGYVTPVVDSFYGKEIKARICGKGLNIGNDRGCYKIDPKESFYVSSGY